MKAVASTTEFDNESVLAVVDLECFRGDRLLFRGINLSLSAGEVLQVHGANGSGKTTLLRILCGLTLPTDGEIRWRGKDISADPARYLADLIHVGHTNGVKLELSSVENLRVAQALAQEPTDVAPATALERFNLYGFEDVPVYTLSAGQRRRVALARLLMSRARLWVLDEPFTTLDKAGVATMESLLHGHAQSGGIVVLTTHQPLSLSAGLAREIYLTA